MDGPPGDGVNLLALDGGGLRAVVEIAVLLRVEEACPGFLASVDMFAGTSTGGIVATALAMGIPPGQIMDLYEKRGPEIFHRPWWRAVTSVGGLLAPKYGSDGLRKALSDTFGGATLGHLPRRVVLTACRLDSGPGTVPRRKKFKVMHNFDNDPDTGISCVDANMRGGAAPTYFRAHQGYVDGGIGANNPAMVAYSEAVKRGARKEDIKVLSLGTGILPDFVEGSPSWGLVQWGAADMIEFLMAMSSDAVHKECETALNGNYARVNPVLPRAIPLDDVSAIPGLQNVGGAADIGAAVSLARRMAGGSRP